jgi:hypothetical protein
MKKKFLLIISAFAVSLLASPLGFRDGKASATVPDINALISNYHGSATIASHYGIQTDSTHIASNGKYVTYSSRSYDIVSPGTSSDSHVFVKNLTSGINSTQSVSTSGVRSNGTDRAAAISETGRYILFTSNASNLVDGTSTPTTYDQLYVRDTTNNTTALLSQSSSGNIADGYSIGQSISEDGRFILFYSTATNLGPTITNTGYNLYMLDRSSGVFTIMDLKSDGSMPSNNLADAHADMSCDGSLVVFQHSANLVLTDTTNSSLNTYLLDRRAGNKLTDLTISTNGGVGASISCNGDYIGFTSTSTTLDPTTTTTPGIYHAYVYNRIENTYRVADRSTAGTVPTTSVSCSTLGDQSCLAISDSDIAVFATNSTTLTGTSGQQMYVRDLSGGVTELLSQNTSGVGANGSSYYPSISSDSKTAAYESRATDLITGTDANSFWDTFTSKTGY